MLKIYNIFYNLNFTFPAGAPHEDFPTATALTSPEKQLRAAAANAAQWAAAIKQALMPVTPQSSGAPSLKEQRTDSMGQKEMGSLKVPGSGGQEIGHLGVQIQSEQEFSQLYQIFADEILGSGQFGTVYGGE